MSIPTIQDRVSCHINLPGLEGTAIEKLKAKRVQGYRRFPVGVGVPQILVRRCAGTWVGLSKSVSPCLYILLGS